MLNQLKSLAKVRPWAKENEDVQRAITYFENQSKAGRMNYAARVRRRGTDRERSTEGRMQGDRQTAAVWIGDEMERPGAAAVLSLRCLTHTRDRWDQFWSKIDRWGFRVAA